MATRSPIYRFAFLFMLWLAVYHESLINMVTVWTQSKTYEHGMIIVPISLWLAWRKKDLLKNASFKISYLPLILMIVPVSLWLLGKAAEIALFEHVALIFSLQLLIWFSIGTQKAKILFFPIFYLVFCVPFGEELIPQLQIITADITVFFIQLSNIPIYREGLFLTVPNGMFEVAEACSGIRFLISSVALGFLFSYLSFTKWYKHVIFITFSFIFPLIANGIRAYGIVLIGYLSDMKYATGVDHLVYGWFFFSFVIISIFLLANKFADVTKNEHFLPISANSTNLNSGSMIVNLLCVAFIIVFTVQLIWQKNLSTREVKKESTSIALPNAYTEMKRSLWGIEFPNAEQSALAKKADSNTEIYIASTQSHQRGSEFISYQNKLYDQSFWTLVSQSKKVIENNIKIGAMEIVNARGVHRYLLYWYCVNDYCTDSRILIKFLKALHVIANNSIDLRFTAILIEDFSKDEIKNLANILNFMAKKIKLRADCKKCV